MNQRLETPLGKWMREKRLRDQWLIENIGVSQSQACRIRLGSTGTSPERAFQIERLTKGKVKASDVLIFSNDANADAPSPRKAAA